MNLVETKSTKESPKSEEETFIVGKDDVDKSD